MPLSRAIVWMASRPASVFRFGASDPAQDRPRADTPFLKVDHRAGRLHAGRPAADLDSGPMAQRTNSSAISTGTRSTTGTLPAFDSSSSA